MTISTPRSRVRRTLLICLAFALTALLASPAVQAGKHTKHYKVRSKKNPVVASVTLPLVPAMTAHLNVAVDDLTVAAAARKARVTLVVSNAAGDASLALCPTLNFGGADATTQGYGYLSGDGTPDCTATLMHPPCVSTSRDPLQTVPACPAAAPVAGDIVTVPGGTAATPGQLVVVHEVLLASLGAGLETEAPADVAAALATGNGTRLEILSGFGSGISSLVCPNGVGALLAAAPAADVASVASLWSRAPIPVAATVTVPTALSSATTLGMAADATANVEVLWQDNLATSLTGNLTHNPAAGSSFTLPKGTFFTGSLTATFPDTLPEGFLGQATVRATDATSGAELARSVLFFAKDTTPPAITAASTVRDADSVDVSLTAEDAGTFLGAARLTSSVGGTAAPAALMDLAAGSFTGPTSFAASIASVLSTQSVGAAVAVEDEMNNVASAVLPVAGAGPDQVVECDSTSGAHVTLDGSLSTVPPESLTTYTWTNSFGSATGPTADVVLPVGDHVVTLTLQDARGFTGTDQTDISVVDTTPPVIDGTSEDPACLWPPNHRMIRFLLGGNFQVQAHDVCDATPTVQIVSVTSDQAADAHGSGNTSPDVAWGPGGFCVRSERAGPDKDGRLYTVTFSVTDDSGNATQGTAQIRVAHDQRGHDCPSVNPAFVVDDGACTPDQLVLTAGATSPQKHHHRH